MWEIMDVRKNFIKVLVDLWKGSEGNAEYLA